MSLEESKDSSTPWLVCVGMPLQAVIIIFLAMQMRYPTYTDTFMKSPLTGPVAFVFLLGVTFIYMSLLPELRTLVFIITWIATHVIWRKNVYPLQEITIEDKHWFRITRWHIGTNVSFGVILGSCVWYEFTFSWFMFVVFFFLTTALATNNSIYLETNVWPCAKHMVYHGIIISNILWCNRSVENMLFWNYRNSKNDYVLEHGPFMTTPSICINCLIALITTSKCGEYNAQFILNYFIMPIVVSLPVWSWDFSKGFRKGVDWKFNITISLIFFVLVWCFINPNVTCDKSLYDKTYEFDDYNFDVLFNQDKEQTRDVHLKVTVGPTFRDVTMVAHGTGNVELFNQQFNTDKRVILAYKLLRTEMDRGCGLQVEWRVNFSWIPRLPVLKTGEEWSFSWLNVLGQPTSLILFFNLNRAEEVKNLKKEIETLKLENKRHEETLEGLKPCETNLTTCNSEIERLQPLEENVTKMVQRINDNMQHDSNLVNVDNLAEKYCGLVKEIKTFPEKIAQKNSKIQNITHEKENAQKIVSDIEKVLSGLEGTPTMTLANQVKLLIENNATCAIQLPFESEKLESCEEDNVQCENDLGVLKNLTQINNTVQMLAHIKGVFAQREREKMELKKCTQRGRTEGFFPTTVPGNNPTTSSQEAGKQAHILRKYAEEPEQEEQKPAEQAQILKDQAEQTEQEKKADTFADAFAGMP